MGGFTADDFKDVDAEALDGIYATSYAPSGEPGTREHAEATAEALELATGSDLFVDTSELFGPPSTRAAMHANVCLVQTASGYAARVLRTLAADPELMERVATAMDGITPAP